MESDSEATPKARFRFGFSGKRKRAFSPENSPVSSDDILDSLTRQAAFQLGFQEQHTQSLEVLSGGDEPTLYSEPIVFTREQHGTAHRARIGHYAFVLMGGVGLVVIWLYSSARGFVGGAFLNSLLQSSSGVHSVFANPAQVAIIFLVALIISLSIAVRRRRARLQVRF